MPRTTSVRYTALAIATAAAPLVGASTLHAQAPGATTFDRTVAPPAGPPTALRVPTWTEETLPNGARLIVIEKHLLPLVSVTIAFDGGSAQFEPPGKHGVASATASALSEGTTTRTGDQLSDALQLLGTTVSTEIGAEQGEMSVLVLRANLDSALALLADELLHPTFPADALKRWQARTLVALQQARSRTSYLARSAFDHVVYGPDHPYGRIDDDSAIKSLTRDDLVAFHSAYFQPSHAIITVVGDIDPAAARGAVSRALGGWTDAAAPVSFVYPALKPPAPTTIYLVDKPGAAQSTVAIGLPGPPRLTPDYYALEVMNTILGTLFQSRLNHNIREEKGWSYGVGSRFAFGKGPGAFEAGGEIVTAKTDSAVVEFLKELKGVQGGKPFTADEIAQGKASLIQSLPERFASVEATSGAITALYLEGLPHDYFQTYADNVRAVTAADMERVAAKYIDLDHLAIVIAGDRKAIEGPLRALKVAPVVVLGTTYDPLP